LREKLWCLRLMLLLVVTALVFSPLAVRGASAASQPVGWNHDPSTLLLPSSPTYTAVILYRDVRMRMADRSFEKSELLLGFANQDAAAINTMARRQDFMAAAAHSSTYQQTFDRCVGWLVVADDRGNDISYLLARVKNDYLAQQVALGHALDAMPEWSRDSLAAARSHTAEVLFEAIRLLEGNDAVQSYARTLSSMLPDLELPQLSPPKPEPPIIVVAPIATEERAGESGEATSSAGDTLEITSLRADRTSVSFNDTVNITCRLTSAGDDDLSYSWWCSRGDLVASGTDARWTAPARAGVYEINVTITDSHGRRDSRSVEIHVVEDAEDVEDVYEPSDIEDEPEGTNVGSGTPASPPVIVGLSLSADHKYLDESLGGGYSMLVSRAATVQCVVEEPGGLEYEWEATGGGEISGSGDTVTLTVPAKPGYVKVTVKVTNGNGEQDTASVTVYVSTCTYCF
jgi:hypothetical protein